MQTLTAQNLKAAKVSNLAYVVGNELAVAAQNGAKSFTFKELCAICENNSPRNLRRAFRELLLAGFLVKSEQARGADGTFGETEYFAEQNAPAQLLFENFQNGEMPENTTSQPCAKEKREKEKEAKRKREKISQIRAHTHTREDASSQRRAKNTTPAYFAEILDDLTAMKRRITLFLPHLEFDFDAKLVEAGFNEAQKAAIERFVAYRESRRTTGERLTCETLANIVSQGVRAIKRGDDLPAAVDKAINKGWQAFFYEKTNKFAGKNGTRAANSNLAAGCAALAPGEIPANQKPHRAPWQQRGWQNKSEFEKQADREREAQIDALLRNKIDSVRDVNGNPPTTPEARDKAFKWLKADFYARGAHIAELL